MRGKDHSERIWLVYANTDRETCLVKQRLDEHLIGVEVIYAFNSLTITAG